MQTCLSYIQGVWETFDAAQPVIQQTFADPSKPLVCRPTDLNSTQLVQQVVSYLSSHQADVNRPAVGELLDVFAALYPCKASSAPASSRPDQAHLLSEVIPPPPPPPTTPDREFLVYFPFEGTRLTPEGGQVVDQAARYAKAAGAKRLIVTGYDDAFFSKTKAMTISQKRARAISAALGASGVDSRIIETRWRGEAELAVPTPAGTKEALNRRVAILLEF